MRALVSKCDTAIAPLLIFAALGRVLSTRCATPASDAASMRNAPRHLGVRHERGFFGVHVCSESGVKLCLVEEQKAVLRRQYRRYRRPWWRVFHECGHRLTF